MKDAAVLSMHQTSPFVLHSSVLSVNENISEPQVAYRAPPVQKTAIFHSCTFKRVSFHRRQGVFPSALGRRVCSEGSEC